MVMGLDNYFCLAIEPYLAAPSRLCRMKRPSLASRTVVILGTLWGDLALARTCRTLFVRPFAIVLGS